MRVNQLGELRGAASAPARHEKSDSISAPLFRSLIDQLAEDRRWVILDLGTAQPETIALLNGVRCRLDIADLTQDIERAAASIAGEAASTAVTLPDMRSPEPADIVLCWDFLNYLDCGALSALMAQIAARCRPGALVHALIVYSGRVMHGRPGEYVPADAGTLLDSARASPELLAPRYSTEALLQAMPDYTVDRVRLLSNGMQEYLFERRSLRKALGPPPNLGMVGSKPVRRAHKRSPSVQKLG